MDIKKSTDDQLVAPNGSIFFSQKYFLADLELKTIAARLLLIDTTHTVHAIPDIQMASTRSTASKILFQALSIRSSQEEKEVMRAVSRKISTLPQFEHCLSLGKQQWI